jgi:uncharacterized CHY-type Zn-finger protein
MVEIHDGKPQKNIVQGAIGNAIFFLSGKNWMAGYQSETITTREIYIVSSINPLPYYLYTEDEEKKDKRETEEKEKKKSKKERKLLCKHCEHIISSPEYRMNFQGAFDHTFLNPSGQMFQIGCFRKADGCAVLGEVSSEWTWFQGFLWQVALCGQCLKHLGWFYQSETDSPFFGLILDALV